MRFRPVVPFLLLLTLLATLASFARGQTGSVVESEQIPTRLPPVSEPTLVRSRLRRDVEAAHLYLGYDRGFLLAADEAVGTRAADANFLMRVNSWAQLRHTYFDSDGPNPDQNTFSFERLRLSFGGHVFSPDVQYFFQFDGNSDRRTEVIFLDYFATYDVGHDLLGYDQDCLGIKFGKWKIPFSRSRQETGRKLQFGERSIANLFFDLDRSIGFGWYSLFNECTVPIHFETAVFNGFKTGSVATSRMGGLDRNFGWSARVFSDLFSEFGDDGEPDLSWHEEPALRLGAAAAFTRINQPGNVEFEQPTVVDSGARLASILPPGVTACDLSLYTCDAHFKWRGFSLIAEYYWRISPSLAA